MVELPTIAIASRLSTATALSAFLFLSRLVIGYGILMATRSISKAVCLALFPIIWKSLGRPLAQTEVPAKCYRVELPTKLITYSFVGFNAVFTVPYLTHFLQLYSF